MNPARSASAAEPNDTRFSAFVRPTLLHPGAWYTLLFRFPTTPAIASTGTPPSFHHSRAASVNGSDHRPRPAAFALAWSRAISQSRGAYCSYHQARPCRTISRSGDRPSASSTSATVRPLRSMSRTFTVTVAPNASDEAACLAFAPNGRPDPGSSTSCSQPHLRGRPVPEHGHSVAVTDLDNLTHELAASGLGLAMNATEG